MFYFENQSLLFKKRAKQGKKNICPKPNIICYSRSHSNHIVHERSNTSAHAAFEGLMSSLDKLILRFTVTDYSFAKPNTPARRRA